MQQLNGMFALSRGKKEKAIHKQMHWNIPREPKHNNRITGNISDTIKKWKYYANKLIIGPAIWYFTILLNATHEEWKTFSGVFKKDLFYFSK